MSDLTHETIAQEELAMNWHDFGTTLSVVAAVACLACAAVAGAGIFWHRWGSRQHRDRLALLASQK